MIMYGHESVAERLALIRVVSILLNVYSSHQYVNIIGSQLSVPSNNSDNIIAQVTLALALGAMLCLLTSSLQCLCISASSALLIKLPCLWGTTPESAC